MTDNQRYAELVKHFTDNQGIDAIDPSELEKLSFGALFRIQEQIAVALKRKTGVY